MPEECRCVLTDRATTRHHAAGVVIYAEGAEARELFILASGQARVRRGGVTLHALVPGDFFGETSFLDMQPRSHTVEVVSDADVYAIPYSALRQLYQADLRAYALAVMNLGREVSRRLRACEQLLAEVKLPSP
jgi:CRP-like cAMP-binding protein